MMKTYPYIGQLQTTNTETNVLYYKQDFCIHMDDKEQKTTNRYNEGAFKNITHEYLQNTYGEVVSPEHAEFIIELAELHGFEVADDDYEKQVVIEKYCKGGELVYFYTWKNSRGKAFIAFSKCKDAACNDGEKQITIPLPPKADSKKWTPDFYELGDLPKHFDCVCNKCGGKCCTGQCGNKESSEWPQIGSKAQTSDGVGIVELLPDTKGYYVVSVGGEYYQYQIDELSKPKTPEEELRDDILDCDNFAITESKANQLANWLTNKGYEIKKKPQ